VKGTNYGAPHCTVFLRLLLLVGSNILLITLFKNTLTLCPSLDVRDEVSHPYKTGKTLVLHILIFMFLDSSQEDKKDTAC
jgi:phosphate starvation-inducible membrane PsiE